KAQALAGLRARGRLGGICIVNAPDESARKDQPVAEDQRVLGLLPLLLPEIEVTESIDGRCVRSLEVRAGGRRANSADLRPTRGRQDHTRAYRSCEHDRRPRKSRKYFHYLTPERASATAQIVLARLNRHANDN